MVDVEQMQRARRLTGEGFSSIRNGMEKAQTDDPLLGALYSVAAGHAVKVKSDRHTRDLRWALGRYEDLKDMPVSVPRDVYAHRREEQRAMLVRAAREAAQARADTRKKFTGPFYAEVEQVLHAAGCVEVRCLFYRRGIVQVRAEGLSFPVSSTRLSASRILNADEAREIIRSAEEALKQPVGMWRTRVDWEKSPPVLYVAKVPVMMGLPGL